MLLAIAMVLSGTAEADPTLTKKAPRFRPEWGGNVSLTHAGAFDAESYPVTSATVGMHYRPWRKHSFSISQSVSKYYEIEQGDNELQLSDTNLGYGYSWGTKWMQINSGLGATLPISEHSHQNQLMTKLSATQTFAKTWDTFTIGTTPFYNLFLNRYKTTPGDALSGGDPLPKDLLGATLDLSLGIGPYISMAVGGSYSRIRYEQTIYTNNLVAVEPNYPSHHYSMDASVTATVWEKISLTTGVGSASQVERYGGVDYTLFDQDTTQWYVSVGYSF